MGYTFDGHDRHLFIALTRALDIVLIQSSVSEISDTLSDKSDKSSDGSEAEGRTVPGPVTTGLAEQ
ncbi:hypothetical protein LCGC14_2106320, partial [marine sediment metagenome]